MNYERIADLTMREGGGTFNRLGEQLNPDRGYAVGLANGTFIQLAADSVDLIPMALELTIKAFPDADAYGTWFDGRYIYIDPVHLCNESLEIALAYGKEKKQKAIYSFATGTTLEIS